MLQEQGRVHWGRIAAQLGDCDAVGARKRCWELESCAITLTLTLRFEELESPAIKWERVRTALNWPAKWPLQGKLAGRTRRGSPWEYSSLRMPLDTGEGSPKLRDAGMMRCVEGRKGGKDHG